MAIDGPLVRILREKDGESRTRFAERVGISMEYLCDIEAGRRLLKRNPGLIKRIADALDVSPAVISRREKVG